VGSLLVALAVIIVGLVVGGFGTPHFDQVMPLWGLLTGLVLGADLTATISGDGLFAEFNGWVAGAALGLLLAGLASRWFRGAVLVLGIGFGSSVVSGLLAAAGIDEGSATLLAGAASGAVALAVIIAGGIPPRLVAAITGYCGATWVAVGVMLMVGRLQSTDLHGVGAAGALRGDVPALAAAFALGTVAFGYQSLVLRAAGRASTIAPGPRWRNRQTRSS
jgi:hypothetical protein